MAPKDEERQQVLPKNNAENHSSGTKDKIKGIFLAFLMTLFVGASVVSVQLLKRSIPDFELNAFRFGTSLVFSVIGLVVSRQSPWIPRCEISGVVIYTILTFLLNLAGYASVSFIPLTYFKSILFTVSIISGLVLFPICINEKTDFKSVMFAILCIVGVILSIQPGFIFHQKEKLDMNIQENNSKTLNHGKNLQEIGTLCEKKNFTSALNENTSVSQDIGNNNNNNNNNNTGNYTGFSNVSKGDSHYFNFTTLGCILATLAGLGDCLFIIVLKRKPFIRENMMSSQIWMSGGGTVFSIIGMMIFEDPILPKTGNQILLTTIHCVGFSLNCYVTMATTKYISGNTMIIIYSLLVILTLIPQYTLLKNILPGNHNWIEVLGTVLVFLGATAGSIWELLKPTRH